MKTIFLQIGRNTLRLTPVKTGKRPVFGPARIFGLPETMQGGNAFSDLPRFAGFIKDCAASAKFGCRRFMLCLDDDGMVSREYQHLPAKPKNLIAFARLEADAVLPDSIDEYVLLNCEYGHLSETTGKLTGSLFAAKNDLIAGLKKSFRRAGMKLVKVTPPAAGLLITAQSILPTFGQTAAVLDLGYEKMRLLVLHNGYPVFLRSFGGIYEDILEIVMREKSASVQDAAALVRKYGVTADGSLSAQASAQISTLLDAGASELVRNIRMVLSSERLELDRIVFCGIMASLPNMGDFWNQLELDIPLENMERRAPTGSLPKLTPKAAAGGVHSSDFIMASGVVSKKASKKFDFLTALNYRSGKSPGNVAALALITFLAVCIMALQPALLAVKNMRAAQDTAALSDAKYAGVQSLLQQEQQLNSRKSTQQADRSALPYGKSKTERAAALLWSQISGKVASVQTYTVDNTAGTVSLSFQVADFDSYLAVKQAIESGKAFQLAAPFTVTAAGKNYVCSVQLKIIGFQTYSQSKGGEAK